jgi:hypothetical protein
VAAHDLTLGAYPAVADPDVTRPRVAPLTSRCRLLVTSPLLDDSLYAENVHAVLHGDQLTVVASPDVPASSLGFLDMDVALAVADAVNRWRAAGASVAHGKGEARPS